MYIGLKKNCQFDQDVCVRNSFSAASCTLRTKTVAIFVAEILYDLARLQEHLLYYK